MKLSQPAAQILLAGHNLDVVDRLAAALRDDPIALRFARSAGQALQFIQNRPADLVLVDLESAGAEGLELMSKLMEHPLQSPAIIIAMTAEGDTAGQLLAFELGALDCLAITTDPKVCRARFLAALQLKHRHDQMQQQHRELMKARTAAEAAARGEIGISRRDEPRDPHPDEWRHRHGQPPS